MSERTVLQLVPGELVDRLGERDLPFDGGVNAVIEKSVVEESSGIPRPQRGRAINQDDIVPPRQVSINVLKRGQTAHRMSVEIAGENFRFIPAQI